MTLSELIGPSWAPVLREEFHLPYMKEISRIVRFHRKRYRVFPEPQNVFRAYHLTPYEDVKVVIIGQDPYPTAGHADGLAFSYRGEESPLPKSLQNIFRELEEDLKVSPPHPSDLSRWAKQGVLLLNTSLTVVEGTPGAHSDIGWDNLVRATITALNQKENQVIYLLWGRHAQSFMPYVKRHHEYLTAAHPSPLAAYRGFFGCRHFSHVNTMLEMSGQEPIDWAAKI